MSKLLITLAMVCLLASTARATTAMGVLGSCKAVVTGLLPNGQMHISPEAQFCWGMFEAFQTLSGVQSTDNEGDGPLKICASTTTTRSQMVIVFLEYAKDHANQLHMDAALVVQAALAQAFPCRRFP
jgi:hypothetical protein